MNQHFLKKYKITGTPSLMQHKSSRRKMYFIESIFEQNKFDAI